MNPFTLTVATNILVDSLAKVLQPQAKRRIAVEAKDIAAATPDSKDRVRHLFESTKQRLGQAWRLGVIMTIVLFALVVALLMAAVVSGLVLNKTTYSIVFGGLSVTSLFTVVIWKPYDMVFRATMTVQRLDMIIVGLEEEWAAAALLPSSERVARIRAANQAALDEMAKIQ